MKQYIANHETNRATQQWTSLNNLAQTTLGKQQKGRRRLGETNIDAVKRLLENWNTAGSAYMDAYTNMKEDMVNCNKEAGDNFFKGETWKATYDRYNGCVTKGRKIAEGLKEKSYNGFSGLWKGVRELFSQLKTSCSRD